MPDGIEMFKRLASPCKIYQSLACVSFKIFSLAHSKEIVLELVYRNSEIKAKRTSTHGAWISANSRKSMASSFVFNNDAKCLE
jgi:hypothetical protein